MSFMQSRKNKGDYRDEGVGLFWIKIPASRGDI